MSREDIKTKSFNFLVPFDIKADPETVDGDTIKISGIANFCGDLSNDSCIEVDLAGEVVVPSGMDVSIYKSNPQILWQHDREYTCGVCDKITKKKDGIYISATLHRGAMEEEDWYRVKNKLVSRLSIGFRCKGGEYKEISGRSVYFITKSLLLEISIVSIPASSPSSFSIVKSLGEDSDGIYSGELLGETIVVEEVDVIDNKNSIGDKNKMNMKVQLKDILSATEVAKLKELGLESKLVEETEVDPKSYVDARVEAALCTFKETFLQELATSFEKIKEVESGSDNSTEEGAVGTVKNEEVTNDEHVTDGTKTEESVQETAEETEAIEKLTAEINQLKALLAEAK